MGYKRFCIHLQLSTYSKITANHHRLIWCQHSLWSCSLVTSTGSCALVMYRAGTDISYYTKYITMLSPPYCLGFGLLELVMKGVNQNYQPDDGAGIHLRKSSFLAFSYQFGLPIMQRLLVSTVWVALYQMGATMGANTQILRSVHATQSNSTMSTTTLFQANVGCMGCTQSFTNCTCKMALPAPLTPSNPNDKSESATFGGNPSG